MNLQTSISGELWAAIKSPYEAGNYSHAILEAVHYLTTILRDKSGADGDGVALVGQALGGDAPKLRVNALQSESDRNIQRGIEQLLRGIYLAVRNPRSHEQATDSQQDADAIIHFLDYVLRILSSSKESFTLDAFVESVSDPEFVESKRYADMLVSEVPTHRRGDALGALFSARRTVDARKLRFLVPTLLSLLTETQVAQYLANASEELRTAADDSSIRTALQMLTPELWPRIAELPLLRIENKLIRTIKEGEILEDGGRTTGSLGTWSSSFIKYFSMREEAANTLIAKLEDTDSDDRHYVAKYFMHRLPEALIEEGQVRRAVRALAAAIRSGDQNVREALVAWVRTFPSQWQLQLAEALKDITDPNNPAVVLDDGTPLLSAPTAVISDDDIPF